MHPQIDRDIVRDHSHSARMTPRRSITGPTAPHQPADLHVHSHSTQPSPPAANQLEQLIAAACHGDRPALEAILQFVGPAMLSASRRVLGPGPDAEDATQEAMVRFVEDLPKLRSATAVRAYAGRLTARIALKIRKRRRRGGESLGSEEMAAIADHRPGSTETVRLRTELLMALDTLHPPQAEAIVMRIVLGYSLPEIAEALACPVNTVRSRIAAGRAALAKHLDNKLETHRG